MKYIIITISVPDSFIEELERDNTTLEIVASNIEESIMEDAPEGFKVKTLVTQD